MISRFILIYWFVGHETFFFIKVEKSCAAEYFLWKCCHLQAFQTLLFGNSQKSIFTQQQQQLYLYKPKLLPTSLWYNSDDMIKDNNLKAADKNKNIYLI